MGLDKQTLQLVRSPHHAVSPGTRSLALLLLTHTSTITHAVNAPRFNSAVLLANRRIQDVHPAWEGFDAEAMWAELDAVETHAAAERAVRAKLQQE